MFATGSGTKLFGGFYYYAKGGTSPNFHYGQFSIHGDNVPVNKWGRRSAQCRLGDDVDFSKNIAFYLYGYGFDSNSILYIKNVKLEFGNKATDWTQSSEDVANNIADVKNSLNSFQNTVNTSFKDGIIEQAEAKAIAQHLKTLDVEKADIDKEYSTIYGNSLLGGAAKTNLANAKTSFDSAHNSLKSTINTVISDGKVTSTEKASVDSTFTTYNGILGTYKQRVQEALDAISSAKVNNIQVGGRNLLRNTSLDGITFPYSGNGYNWRTASVNDGAGVSRTKVAITDNNSFRETIYGIKVVNTSSTIYICEIAQDNVKMEDGVTYTMSAYFKVTSGNPTWILEYGTSPYRVQTGTAKSGWNKCSYTFKYDKTQFSNKLTTNIYFGFTGANFEGYVCGFKLERGNKATDWSPAPEDVTSNIANAKTEAINSANNTLTTTIANYYTKAQTDSQINVAKEAINLGVSSTYETKAYVETKVSSTLNSAKSYADTKKSEAINSAATDATNKVNAAKSELNTAINKKANSADVYTKTQVYT